MHWESVVEREQNHTAPTHQTTRFVLSGFSLNKISYGLLKKLIIGAWVLIEIRLGLCFFLQKSINKVGFLHSNTEVLQYPIKTSSDVELTIESKVLKRVNNRNFGHNVKVFEVTATTIVATFVHNFPQHQGSQQNCNHNRNLKPFTIKQSLYYRMQFLHQSRQITLL